MLARPDPCHVGGGGTCYDPEPIGAMHQISDFCTPNLIFAGQAVARCRGHCVPSLKMGVEPVVVLDP
jgi:hypothetical protein